MKRVLNAITEGRVLSDYSLLSLVAGVEYILNDRSLTPMRDDPRDLTPLTPNSILVRTLDPLLPFDRFHRAEEYRKSYRYGQRLMDLFWDRCIKEYLPILQLKNKWTEPGTNVAVNDLVLLVDEFSLRKRWPLGRVAETLPGLHGAVRRLKVRTSKSTLVRNIRKLCP